MSYIIATKFNYLSQSFHSYTQKTVQDDLSTIGYMRYGFRLLSFIRRLPCNSNGTMFQSPASIHGIFSVRRNAPMPRPVCLLCQDLTVLLS